MTKEYVSNSWEMPFDKSKRMRVKINKKSGEAYIEIFSYPDDSSVHEFNPNYKPSSSCEVIEKESPNSPNTRS